ncbi:MAG: cytochrome c [Rhizobiaceae bacterium]|nr:cytochrome c [Rhizobiaceae bacterium]
MRLPALAASLACLTPTLVHANPIDERQSLMKERGQIMRALGPIAQGREPFDAATVMDALEALNRNAQAHDVAALYPAGSEGGDAAAAIWQDLDGLRAADDKYKDDVAAAFAAAPQDLDAFRVAFGPAAQNCGACHELYRD